MASTSIEWTDCVWNPVSGCSHVSSGCKNCYAERMDRRQILPGRKDGFRPWTAQNAEYNVRLHPERLEQPLHWRKPRRVFVNSMSDLFHERVPDEFIGTVFAVMANAKNHSFQILTKRPRDMRDWCTDVGRTRSQTDAPWPLPNVHLGVSCENQKTFDERVPLLLQTPAAVRWVSLEPLLGPINMTASGPMFEKLNRLRPHQEVVDHGVYENRPALDWIVCGGESGPGARPMPPRWVRDIRDQCVAASVPFLFKQWGEWAPDCLCRTKKPHRTTKRPGPCSPLSVMFRCGKKAAGRQLDGRTWDEFPEVTR